MRTKLLKPTTEETTGVASEECAPNLPEMAPCVDDMNPRGQQGQYGKTSIRMDERLPLGCKRMGVSYVEYIQIECSATRKFDAFTEKGGLCYRLYDNLFVYDPGHVIARKSSCLMLDVTYPEDVLSGFLGKTSPKRLAPLSKELKDNKMTYSPKSGWTKYDVLIGDYICLLIEKAAVPIDRAHDPHQNPALSHMLRGNSTEPYVQYLLKTLHGAKP